MLPPKFQNYKELAEKATPGPWDKEMELGVDCSSWCHGGTAYIEVTGIYPAKKVARATYTDIELMAASRTAVPELCKALEIAMRALTIIRDAYVLDVDCDELDYLETMNKAISKIQKLGGEK